jgi:hypothetical protein
LAFKSVALEWWLLLHPTMMLLRLVAD